MKLLLTLFFILNISVSKASDNKKLIMIIQGNPSWCPPCKALEESINQGIVSTKGVEIIKINDPQRIKRLPRPRNINCNILKLQSQSERKIHFSKCVPPIYLPTISIINKETQELVNLETNDKFSLDTFNSDTIASLNTIISSVNNENVKNLKTKKLDDLTQETRGRFKVETKELSIPKFEINKK